MKNIKDIISTKRFLFGIDINNLMLLDYIWKENFSELSSMCDIKSIEKNVLVLKPHNNIIKSEIQRRKDIIIRELNKNFKKKFIKDIKFSA